MGFDDPLKQTDHAHLIRTLSAMLVQLNGLQIIARDDIADSAGESQVPHIQDMNAIRKGLATLEQMTREMLFEVRTVSDDMPLADLSGVPLAEALSRAVEETAETQGFSSRVVFSGEERPLSSYSERLLYRIAHEALDQDQHHTNILKSRSVLTYGRDEAKMSMTDAAVPSEH